MLCPRCNAQTPAGDEFCVQCGLDLRTVTTYCPGCGAPSASGDAFCASCGTSLLRDATADLQTSVRIAATEKAAGPAEIKPAVVSRANGTALSHKVIRDIAAGYEYNSLSPLSALNSSIKKGLKVDIPVEKDILDAILKPSKCFYLTAKAGGKLKQQILLVKGPLYCRWTDEEGTVLVSKEKSARNFIDYIYGEISRDMAVGEKSAVILKREQIVILKAINALGQALARTKVRTVFTTYGYLKQLLQTDDGLKGRLDGLAKDGMVSMAGSGDFIITLSAKGGEIIKALEDYDVFYTLQVLNEGTDEFPSVYLTLSNSKLYMLSNPKNGDEVVVRTLDKAGLRSVLNWMWTAKTPA